MLDISYILENISLIEKVARDKRIDISLGELVDLDRRRRSLIKELDKLKSERNSISRSIPGVDVSVRGGLISRSKEIGEVLSVLESEFADIKLRYESLMLRVPNVVLDSVPVGVGDSDNVELYRRGIVPEFSFEPRDHMELGKLLSIVDMERGVKVSGSKNYFLKGDGVLLELGLLRFSLDFLCSRGFSPFIVPLMVKKDVMYGTGYFPGGEDQSYYVDRDDRYLIGTSEVSLVSYYKDEVLDVSSLPLRMAGISNCFRREAGAYGKDSYGLYRIHQFQKVEQVLIGFNDAVSSERLHYELLANAEGILDALGLPYRVVLVCTGDLGLGQVIKHDIEVWMPSRGSYGETHSCSSFYEFQARRLNIKYRDRDGKVHFAHTLNNTAIASPRILIPLLENYQLEDARVLIPEVLRQYMNGREYIELGS